MGHASPVTAHAKSVYGSGEQLVDTTLVDPWVTL